jgi:hypothetical protein
MRRRLYFMLPDLGSATRTANDLLLARVEDRHMHFLGRRGMDLGPLRPSTYLQKSDLRHSLYLGLLLGAALGFVFGIYMYLTPGESVHTELVTVLVAALVGSLFGAWACSLVGVSTPNVTLKRFQSELDAGRILLMVDVPKPRVEEIQDLIHSRHAEASDYGVDRHIPVFP